MPLETEKMLIERALQKHIEKRIGENKALIIYGTRRVGKTKLLEATRAKHQKKTLLLNAEDMSVQAMLAQRTAANYKRMLGKHELLMIDEAQEISGIGKHLKFLLDTFPRLTIIATGSSSFDLMNKSGEPLTGRRYQFTLNPVSQGELVRHEGFPETRQQLDERLVFGTYPETLRMETPDEKQAYLQSLVHTYLLKDIFMYETIKNSSKIFDLLKLIAHQVGSEVSLDKLGRNLGMSKNTVERYLDLLTKVFVLFRVGGYSGNLRKEVVKSSKWYFYDNGIRNALLADFRPLTQRTDNGQLWENFCFYERIKRQRYAGKLPEYYFWRTYDRQEIDMIERENTRIRAFEFKWGNAATAKLPKAFGENYPKATFEIISKENYAEFVE
ncbi:MAG: ATP-binding protein [Chitinophagales bacterium]|nr:ATP-binding protein [Chitinophagales bacterium]